MLDLRDSEQLQQEQKVRAECWWKGEGGGPRQGGNGQGAK